MNFDKIVIKDNPTSSSIDLNIDSNIDFKSAWNKSKILIKQKLQEESGIDKGNQLFYGKVKHFVETQSLVVY